LVNPEFWRAPILFLDHGGNGAPRDLYLSSKKAGTVSFTLWKEQRTENSCGKTRDNTAGGGRKGGGTIPSPPLIKSKRRSGADPGFEEPYKQRDKHESGKNNGLVKTCSHLSSFAGQRGPWLKRQIPNGKGRNFVKTTRARESKTGT